MQGVTSSSSSSNSSSEDLNTSTAAAAFVGERLTVSVVYPLVALHVLSATLGFSGTGLVLGVLLTSPYYRQRFNNHVVYMLAVCAVDVLMVALHCAVPLDYVLGRHPVLNDVHCAVNGYLLTVGFNLRFYLHAAVCADRCLRFCRRSLHRRCRFHRRSTNAAVCLVLVTCGLLLQCSMFVIRGDLHDLYDPHWHICVVKKKSPFGVVSAVTVAALVLCVVTMAVSNTLIWRRFKTFRRDRRLDAGDTARGPRGNARHVRRLEGTTAASELTRPSLRDQGQTLSDSRLLRCLFVDLLVSVVLNVQAMTVRHLQSGHHVSADVSGVVMWVSSLDIPTNWIIYGVVHYRFRQHYKKVLCNLRPNSH